jgi:cytochrome c peroxidase
VALQPTFMHNGAFVRLEDAIRHHLDVEASTRTYSPRDLAPDLRGPTGPIAPVLERLDPRLRHPQRLSDGEFGDLLDFLHGGLLDPAAGPARLRRLVPERLPSGRAPLRFEFP